ncbi:MAG: hypothetical protein ABSE21_04350 [Bryobacteraceae bacterium]
MIAFLFCALPSAQPQSGVRPQSKSQDSVAPPVPEVTQNPDRVLREEYAKNLEDLHKMQRLLWEVRTEVAKGTPYVLPLQSIKKLEEIEKLSKTIRSRMRLH